MSSLRQRILPYIPLFPSAAPIAQQSRLHAYGKDEREEGREGTKICHEQLFLQQHTEAGNRGFAAGARSSEGSALDIKSEHRRAVRYVRECGRRCWRILCWAAPEPWGIEARRVRDMLSQEPRRKLF